MNQTSLLPVFTAWFPDAVVSDGASAHRGKAICEIGFGRIFSPPYSPDLNPAERVFELIRDEIEDKVYRSLKAKRQAIDHLLRGLNANKSRLCQLVDWQWIQDTFDRLPAA